jgi:3-isopropylmalate dehydrogenase
VTREPPRRIAVIPGDGIGREVITESVRVVAEVARRHEIPLEFEEGLAGGAAIDARGHPIPPETLDLCRRSDAILLGACGGPKWDRGPRHLRPEQALFTLRKTFGLYANLRPATVSHALVNASPLRREVVLGADLLVVRELTGGLYFGTQSRSDEGGETSALDTLPYSASEVGRVIRRALEIARTRPRRKVTSVDKANVLETSRLWREVAVEEARDFPDVTLEHMLVDNCALQLVRDPRQFDVIVTENMFGDILSDEAAGVMGSLGLMPSASLGDSPPGLFEPVHGTAPDIAGRGIANPLAAILTGALLLRYGLRAEAAAVAVEEAVRRALEDGCRTADMAGTGERPALGTVAMTDAVLARLR